MPEPADDRVAAVRVLARLYRLIESVDSGLTLPQYRVLSAIDQGGVRSAHLAERLAVRGPTLTAIADGLVAAGYATRESEPGDRRVVRLHATEAGRAALREADTHYLGKIGPILDAAGGNVVPELIAVGAALDERLKAKMPGLEPPGTKPLDAEPADDLTARAASEGKTGGDTTGDHKSSNSKESNA